MRFYLDAEFWERPGSIDLISIALVGEDGRELYMESNEFNWTKVMELVEESRRGSNIYRLNNNQLAVAKAKAETPNWLMQNVYPNLLHDDARRSQPQMAAEILRFVQGDDDEDLGDPKFFGWYCDYDWVVFCWLFGSMVELPKSFPKFCRDLRQYIETTGINAKDIPIDGNEHNALADARWNKKVHDAILQRA